MSGTLLYLRASSKHITSTSNNVVSKSWRELMYCNNNRAYAVRPLGICGAPLGHLRTSGLQFAFYMFQTGEI
jgi:hypothetical protein